MNTDAITIEYGNGTLTAEDFVDDGFILEENLCSASQIAFGACEAAAVEVRIASTAASFVGKTLTVKLGANALGKYKVVSDERAYDGETRILTAYDALYDVNGQDVSAWYESIDWNVVTNLRQFRDSFFRYLGITQATADLVNDEMPVKKTMETASCSGATILQAICEVNGVFGHMNANGHFQYVSLSNGEPTVVNADEVLDSLTEDFTVPAFDGVLIRTEEGDIGGQYPASGAQNQYIITGNFLCYGKTTAELQSIAQNALSKIGGKTYVPFEANLECQGNIALGGKVTIPTEPATFTSYVLQRKLVGFEDLEEYFVAQGSPEYVPDVNSARNQMVATSQRINKLTSTVEGAESRVAEIEKDYAKESVIKQLPHEILLQASETSEGGTPQKATITLTVKDGKGSVVSTEAVDILFNGLVTFTNNAKQSAIDAAATDATNKTKAITDHIYKAGTTSIDGGVIDTESLFTRDITATNLKITGGSVNISTSTDTASVITLSGPAYRASYSAYQTLIDNDNVGKRIAIDGQGVNFSSYTKTSSSFDVTGEGSLEFIKSSTRKNYLSLDAKINDLMLSGINIILNGNVTSYGGITFDTTGAVFDGSYNSLTGKPTSLPANGGNASTATALNNYYDSRPTTANLATIGDGKMRTFKATSSMVTGKPMQDGHIIHLSWDNTGGYDSELYVPASAAGTNMQWRHQQAGVWQEWKTLLNASDIAGWAKAATKPSYTASEVNAGKFISIGGQQSSYRVTVIALCECSKTDKNPNNSYSAGTIYGHRSNGLYNMRWFSYQADDFYTTANKFNLNIQSANLDYSTTLAKNVRVGNAYRSCTFTYGGKQYGGILYFAQDAESGFMHFSGGGNFTPFAVDIWRGDNNTILNAEIYNSISYDTANIGSSSTTYARASDVYAWAKAATKPSYTAAEVGARASTWTPSKSDITTALGTTYGTSLAISGNNLSLKNGSTTISTVAIPTSGGGGGTSAHFHHWNKLNSAALAVNGTCQWTYGQYDSIAVTGAWRGSIRSTMIIPLPDIENLTIGTAKSYDMTFWSSNWLQFTLTKNNNGMVTLTYTAYNTSAQNSDGTIIEAIYGQGNIIT